jgi:predicted regulator of Ras-like GTPase activity (Roadblock/LC7/MglB family)
MADPSLIMYEEEFKLIDAELHKLHQQANAKLTLLVDKNGQVIQCLGETDNVDTTSLGSLTAGNIAAAGGMAQLLGEKEFSILFHEGERDNIHITLVSRVILVVIFDQRSSLGLVRLRVKKSADVLSQIFEKVLQKLEKPKTPPAGAPPQGTPEKKKSPLAEITDEDIDKLFS